MDDGYDAIRGALRGGPPLTLAVVFGSFATGLATATSDIDIAIVPVDSALSLIAAGQLSAQIEKICRRAIDLVRLDLVSTFLRWHVARDGQLLYASSPNVWTRFRADAASEHADFAEPFARAAELYRRRIARFA